MTYREETTNVTTRLARWQNDLVVAIAADQLRSRRRRRGRLGGLAIAVTLAVVGGSVAATTGLFSPAPDNVKNTFEGLNDGAGVDASKAIEIGVIDDHAVYAAPTADGGFCLYFAANPRSGPSGSACVAEGARPGEIALNVSLGNDGGFVFGRVEPESAATVEIELPGGGTVKAPVGEERFFLADLPESALRALMRGEAVTATAKDAQGTTVARSNSKSQPEPGAPTETGPVPDDASVPVPE